jgi:ABC-type branched-subunit amino acid transport system ATPase component
VIHLSLHELSVNFGGLRAVDRVTSGIEVGQSTG